jgi:hypothetical protein
MPAAAISSTPLPTSMTSFTSITRSVPGASRSDACAQDAEAQNPPGMYLEVQTSRHCLILSLIMCAQGYRQIQNLEEYTGLKVCTRAQGLPLSMLLSLLAPPGSVA